MQKLYKITSEATEIKTHTSSLCPSPIALGEVGRMVYLREATSEEIIAWAIAQLTAKSQAQSDADQNSVRTPSDPHWDGDATEIMLTEAPQWVAEKIAAGERDHKVWLIERWGDDDDIAGGVSAYGAANLQATTHLMHDPERPYNPQFWKLEPKNSGTDAPD